MQDSIRTFIPTHAAGAAFRTLDALRAGRAAGLLVGDTGSGKTALLRAYQRHARQCTTGWAPVVLYRATVINTPRSVVRDLLAGLGVLWHGSTRGGFSVLRQIIREEGVELVLVDDVGRLARHSLDLLRAIHEATGVAVALAGAPEAGRRLAGKSAELVARLHCVHVLGALGLDDALAVVNHAGIGRKRRGYWGRVALARALLRAANGNFRRLLQVLDAARARARKAHRSVTAATVAHAAQELPGLTGRKESAVAP